ncbi:uncharacterized protein PHACADRAFT_83084 [Phanerochaete carnosa HHB-10118-sp]|uniref:Uncharacterized protein n=1 Tax=Phanerochaete carnosa (strain HHB-10118-sp) TaxID=650164 RepID=K5XEA7_PHACS|nr:uncharacterized protein PHACADRAFT_83084 [Phanerochaete carnosa HHB-10118-sp]EKM61372.1 hypothetical protein PHACADRAFT_83084 [Phanerochaete carnosa HHB-10118-sp]
MPRQPPDYESQNYWEHRFKTETHFEWLGDGHDTIVPVLRAHLLSRHKAKAMPPLCLHIGAGASTLSDDLLQEYHTVFEKAFHKPIIFNADFASEVVGRGAQVEQGRGSEVVWEQADLLQWKDMLTLEEKILRTEGRRFGLVVDKGTADAIACGKDMELAKETLNGSPRDAHPLIYHEVSQYDADILYFHPVDVLALHLASLVEPDGVWLSLSYSAARFMVLEEGHEEEGLMTRLFWKMERVISIRARPGSAEPGKHVPDVYHYLYVLRRTDTATAIE